MPLVIAVAVFGLFFLLTVMLYQQLTQANPRKSRRISEVLGSQPVPTVRERELKAPFYQRAIKPILGMWSQKLIKMLPAEKEAELGRRINYANLQSKIAPRELLVIKYLAGGLAAVLGALAGTSLVQQVQSIFILSLLGLLAGWYGPDFYLQVKGRQRQQAIEKSLPDVLDLLTVSVEAGLGFDGALLKVVEKSKGPLAEEFGLTLQEIRMGKPRAEALRDLSGRTGVHDLASFTGAVILADQLGLSIGNVLRLQAEQIRLKRRQRAEELAMKAPVKMLIPMVFFIFPAIFVVLLGPAVIQITKYFIK
ncbi:Type II secretion system F domain [Moorella glycerini]|uniref:Bacterial type II secretion system protein F domain protein n=1 Tax=Neomoorella stamsii TaxID=1266720 RepID=A0A9X7P660_9FIRM|nr:MULTISPECIES: type II secretion system F family protein [Moorella]PRR72782.1 Bacterial type II secretion system protein F domain protein [Moorella stamsii]CEP66281.1 Type II secretion system F domain [Moorella glycerini]CEP68127.1 Type II secretion system F domain [Moorella glycerini]